MFAVPPAVFPLPVTVVIAVPVLAVIVPRPVVARSRGVDHGGRGDIDGRRHDDVGWHDNRRRNRNGHSDDWPREVDADTHAHIGGIGRRGDEHGNQSGAGSAQLGEG